MLVEGKKKVSSGMVFYPQLHVSARDYIWELQIWATKRNISMTWISYHTYLKISSSRSF